MGLFSNLFTWWHGPSLGTQLFSRRAGREVGRDGFGNVYFASKAETKGVQRRWVMYSGVPEASRIPPEWYLWLHKTIDTTPAEAPLKPRVWEQPWTPNATGTAAAYAPSGSLLSAAKRARAIGDYEAWTPD